MREFFITKVTLERFLSGVYAHVSITVPCLAETSGAEVTLEWLDSAVDDHVSLKREGTLSIS